VFISGHGSVKVLERTASYILIVLAICLWELISRSGIVSIALFPPPSTVFFKLYLMSASGVLLQEYFTTLYRVLVGFLSGAILGMVFGVLIAYSRMASRTLYPIIAMFSVMPTLALVPLLIIWIGLNDMLAITAVFLCSFIPLAYNTVSGIRHIDPEVVDVAKTLGASRLELLAKILLPQALPSIFSALKLEAAMAWKTCFVTEFIALSSGLGRLMIEALNTLSVDGMIALLLILALSSYGFVRFFEELEKSFLAKWGYRV